MAGSVNIPAYSDALVVLGTAGIVVPLALRWGLSPILGYLGAGALLGPLALGSFIDVVPLLYWFTVVDAKNVSQIADLGVVFLLFLIGLELSAERLKTMRRLVLGLGSLQVVVTTTVLTLIIHWAGLKPSIAFVLGACLALSSTAIVLEVLSSQQRLTRSVGRASFAVLLAQDIAVIPILIYISVLGTDKTGSVIEVGGIALFQAIAALAIIVVVGRLFLRPLFRLVAASGSNELFLAAIFFVIVATGVVAAMANLSMALGAFVAGLLLAETEYRKSIEATVAPFKGLLLGIFFFTVGMSIDVRELAREPGWLLLCAVGLVGLKAGLLVILGRLFKLTWPVAIESALLLGPGGEFALVGIGLASSLAILTPPVASFAVAVTSLTMVFIPVLASVARRVTPVFETPKPTDTMLVAEPAPLTKHAIVVGHGRVGKVLCQMLRRHGVAYTAVEYNAHAVARDRAAGHDVYFGDAANPAFLQTCGLMGASGIIITAHLATQIDAIVHEVRKLRPDILIVSRARDAEHAKHLYAIGVSDAVPETIEASLQLSEAALVGLGIPTGWVIASIHEQRDEFRQELQQTANTAGKSQTRSVRASMRKRES